MTAKSFETFWLQATTGRNLVIFSGTGGMKSMKHALLPFALGLTLMAGFVTSTIGSVEPQNSSPSTSPNTVATIYDRRCASCHGKDGRAKTFKGNLMSARELTDPKWQADVSDERIFNSITNGRGKMPGFGKKLSEAEINSLVSYVRGLKK
jgi:mono/diheme cytochrome c family protein